MTNEKIETNADVFIEGMLRKANEIIGKFKAEGMSEDDIIDVLTDAFCGSRKEALDWYHAATFSELIDSFK